MKFVTIRVFLVILIAVYSIKNVLHANELMKQYEFSHINETHHLWGNERNGRTGMLIVSGALLSSPCTLETNEVDLLKEMQPQGMLERYVFKLNLTGCGDGFVKKTSSRVKTIATLSALLYNKKEGMQPELKMLSNGKVVLHNGRNQLIYYMSKNQRQTLINQHRSDHIQITQFTGSSLLHLMLGYE
ncbi:pilus-assembly fibrillin subunit [Providencia alcalifaciens]|uniref:pilus-assembly fibrillin subunit n=1 Tax=Providencia alcalifaciens TaxID=126385 RepID=UPI0032D9E916